MNVYKVNITLSCAHVLKCGRDDEGFQERYRELGDAERRRSERQKMMMVLVKLEMIDDVRMSSLWTERYLLGLRYRVES